MFERRNRNQAPPTPEKPFVPRVRKYTPPETNYRKHRPEPLPEGRIEIEREPGQPDRGSAQYRIDVLRALIRANSGREPREYYDPGGW